MWNSNRDTAIPRWITMALVLFGIVLHAAGAMAEPRTLDGAVIYRERMALPPNAVVEVKLVDVSRADAPSTTIAETRVTSGGQVPIRYQLQFDSADLQPRRTYALQARITVDDRLWFITTTRRPTVPGKTNKADIMVQRVRAERDAPSPATPAGRWLAEDIRGGGVIDRLQTVLQIGADGAVSGSGGCNSMTGTATISGDSITFSPIASTRMACTPAAMN